MLDNLNKSNLNKTYEIQDSRLEGLVVLNFSENQAMITCTEFADLNFMIDVMYINKFTQTFKMNSNGFTDGADTFYVILLEKIKKES